MEAPSRTPLLLVSTATGWLGTARIPRALAEAGFDVALLTPRNALAEKGRYLTRVGYLPDNATPAQWASAFGAMVEATSPRIVVPCDDMAFRLLHMLVQAGRTVVRPDLALRLSVLIRQSLGDPAHYEASVDKTLMPSAVQALGIRVPPHAVVEALRDAEAFAAAQGYPVVLKRAHGFAGQGVAICADDLALGHAFEDFTRVNAQDPMCRIANRHLVQAHIPGRIQYYIATAWNGELLAGYAGEKVVANPEPVGPPTVARYFRAPVLREITARLVRGFGISGHFFAEFVVSDPGGEAEPARAQPAHHARIPPRQRAQRRFLRGALCRRAWQAVDVGRRHRRGRRRHQRVLPRRMAARSRQSLSDRVPGRHPLGRARAVRGAAGAADGG